MFHQDFVRLLQDTRGAGSEENTLISWCNLLLWKSIQPLGTECAFSEKQFQPTLLLKTCYINLLYSSGTNFKMHIVSKDTQKWPLGPAYVSIIVQRQKLPALQKGSVWKMQSLRLTLFFLGFYFFSLCINCYMMWKGKTKTKGKSCTISCFRHLA